MTALGYIGRLLIQAMTSQYAQDTLSTVGRYVARQASAALIRSINERTKPRRKTMETIK